MSSAVFAEVSKEVFDLLPSYIRSIVGIWDIIEERLERYTEKFYIKVSSELKINKFEPLYGINIGNVVEDVIKQATMQELRTSNTSLNQLVEVYFINWSGLLQARIGVFSFKDIEHDFTFVLKEYSITHSRKCELPCGNITLEELLSLNEISTTEYGNFINKVDKFLELHRKGNVSHLKKQVLSLYSKDDGLKAKEVNEYFFTKLYKQLCDAEINQFVNDRYIVVDAMFTTRQLFIHEAQTLYKFSQKKKELKKIEDISKRLKALKKYIESILRDEAARFQSFSEDKSLLQELQQKTIRYFLWYLVYDGNKHDVYVVHSIFGYGNENILEVYKRLFHKKNKTAEQDFFRHSAILEYTNITDEILTSVLRCL